jgi:hypothetical protein
LTKVSENAEPLTGYAVFISVQRFLEARSCTEALNRNPKQENFGANFQSRLYR